MTVLLYCEIGAHAKCSIRRCSCPCHGVRQASGDLRPVDRRPPPSPEPHPQIKEPTVTDTIGEATRMLEDRIVEIDDELERYDELRAERKQIEKTLSKLRPPVTRVKREIDDGPSLHDRILGIVATDTTVEWVIGDILSALELDGWECPNDDPKHTVGTACSNLSAKHQLVRVRRGTYKAAA